MVPSPCLDQNLDLKVTLLMVSKASKKVLLFVLKSVTFLYKKATLLDGFGLAWWILGGGWGAWGGLVGCLWLAFGGLGGVWAGLGVVWGELGWAWGECIVFLYEKVFRV